MKKGQFKKGSENPKWKGGKAWLHKKGYMCMKVDNKFVWEHRHIMEQHLGRKLLKHEEVHHKNEIKTDNRLSNLEVINKSKHLSQHKKQKLNLWKWIKRIIKRFKNAFNINKT